MGRTEMKWMVSGGGGSLTSNKLNSIVVNSARYFKYLNWFTKISSSLHYEKHIKTWFYIIFQTNSGEMVQNTWNNATAAAAAAEVNFRA